LVTVTKSVAGVGRIAFVNWATICEPPAFTVVLEAGTGVPPGKLRFTAELDWKFAPRIVSVKFPLPGAVVVAGKLGGLTSLMKGTAVAGTVCASATEVHRSSASTAMLARFRVIRTRASGQEGTKFVFRPGLT
jgi:hypothetical protein